MQVCMRKQGEAWIEKSKGQRVLICESTIVLISWMQKQEEKSKHKRVMQVKCNTSLY